MRLVCFSHQGKRFWYGNICTELWMKLGRERCSHVEEVHSKQREKHKTKGSLGEFK